MGDIESESWPSQVVLEVEVGRGEEVATMDDLGMKDNRADRKD